MDIGESLYVSDREAWRAWLAANHADQSEIWLVFYKKHTGVPSVAYDEAVEEALCFGWIDSIMKRIDADRYAQRFSPRKNTANWSPLNMHRIAKMAKAGKMTEAGWAAVTFDVTDDLLEPPPPRSSRETLTLPPHIETALRANPVAWEAFNRLAPSERRRYIGWITSAKREETQMRRVAEAIDHLIRGEPLGMK